jgi:NADPH:quinone reductase-like Zn-dependent oxidoreductase
MQQLIAGENIQTIEKVYPFSETSQALDKVKTRHNRGKLVITLKKE